MQIILNSLDELRDLVAVLHPDFAARVTHVSVGVTSQKIGRAHRPAPHIADEVSDVPSVSGEAAMWKLSGGAEAPFNAAPGDAGPLVSSETDAIAGRAEPTEVPPVDATGRPWDERIDSSNKALTDKGVWRARRNVAPELREQVLGDWEAHVAEKANAAEVADSGEEPVATETHALPKDEPQTADQADPNTEAAPVDAKLVELVAASKEAAQDASDSHADLLKACQAFIGAYGHPAFNALKNATAPVEGSTHGKMLPNFTPGERRLLQACMANYPLHM